MELMKIVGKRKKRQGQGAGSGKGFHTSGRGQKGQKSRRKIHVLFEGYKVKKSLLRRLPLQRGAMKFKKQTDDKLVIHLEDLNIFDNGSEVNIKTLSEKGLVNTKEALKYGVKIVGDGEITKKLTIDLPISKSAAQKVIDAKGNIKVNA